MGREGREEGKESGRSKAGGKRGEGRVNFSAAFAQEEGRKGMKREEVRRGGREGGEGKLFDLRIRAMASAEASQLKHSSTLGFYIGWDMLKTKHSESQSTHSKDFDEQFLDNAAGSDLIN